MIGINNQNLPGFTVDLDTFRRLAPRLVARMAVPPQEADLPDERGPW